MKQTTLDGFLSPAAQGGRKRSAPDVIVLSSDEDEGSAPQPSVASTEAPRKRVKTKATASASASDGHDEGEIEDSGPSLKPSPTGSEAAGSPAEPRHTWNEGVSETLRLKFRPTATIAAPAQAPPPGQEDEQTSYFLGEDEQASDSSASDSLVEDGPGLASATTISASARVKLPKPSPPDSIGVETWDLSFVISDDYKHREKGKPKKGKGAGAMRTWKGRFEKWCDRLLELNAAKPGITDPQLVRKAWSFWLHFTVKAHENLRAKAEVEPTVQALTADELMIMGRRYFRKAARAVVAAAPSQETGRGPVTKKLVENGGDVAREKPGERERYYPGVGPDEVFCVRCTSRTHLADVCPHLACLMCHGDHSTLSCPGQGAEEGKTNPACRLCQSASHIDQVCDQLWRTYEPEPSRIRKIRSLEAYCYSCGEQGHYGPECSGGPARHGMWTRSNLEMYLDAESLVEAITLTTPAGAFKSLENGKPNLGRSIAPQRHIIYVEDDESDDNNGFIRPPVTRDPVGGRISFRGHNNVPPPPPSLPPPPPPPLGDYRGQNNRNNYGYGGDRPRGRVRRGRGGQNRGGGDRRGSGGRR